MQPRYFQTKLEGVWKLLKGSIIFDSKATSISSIFVRVVKKKKSNSRKGYNIANRRLENSNKGK